MSQVRVTTSYPEIECKVQALTITKNDVYKPPDPFLPIIELSTNSLETSAFFIIRTLEKRSPCRKYQ